MFRPALTLCCAFGLVACGISKPPGAGADLGGTTGTTGTAGSPGLEGSGGAGGRGLCAPGQPILGDVGVVNARDLGGTPLADGGAVACGAVYRGPPLANFSAQACDAFAALGIRTVIDLRIESERGGKQDSPCVAAAAHIVLAPMPVPYSVSPKDYVADVNATTSIAKAFEVLGDPAAYPVYVHCTWGRDRTGVFSAIVLLALGASREAILKEYLLSQSTVGAYPDSLVAVFDEIDRQGGIEAYLTAAGIPAEQVATLRMRTVAP
jgi:protein-tyrosine phosphatase